ncbi:hypothetical protein OEZ86_000951 [Tetradesmus obliquus]|nr:hypothetical protein OEZ86_000951 [Tetradesmus obliquus]
MAASLGNGPLQQFALVVQHQLPTILQDGGVQLAITLQQQVAYSTRVQVTATVALLCGAWLRLVVSKAAPSLWSLLLVVPLVAFNTWVPLLFHYREELISRCTALLLLLWLGSYKAMGLCLGRGPLAGQHWTVGQTCLLYIMPIYPSQDTGGVKKGRLTDNHGTSAQAALSFVANTAFCVSLAYLLAVYDMPVMVKYYVYFLALYGFITFLMDGPAALLISVLGLKVVPPFDRPWAAANLGDFWSRRWNNTVSLTLRALVYDPLVEGCLIKQQQQQQQPGKAAKASLWLRLAGMAATFAVSGVMHEVILFYVSHEGQFYPGYWFTFFAIQAPVVLAEALIYKRLAAADIRVPRLLGTAVGTVILMTLATYLWYPPIDTHTDIAASVVAGINKNAAAVLGWMRQQVGSWGFDAALADLAGIAPATAAAV